jgi:hypothetical protein
VLFFRGCGVDRTFLARIERRIDAEPTFSKYHITREILAHVNELGDRGLGQRRQVLKRVSEFDDFSSCYPDNQLKARGAVATVAQLINKKDSFTRLQEERERELKQHREAKRAENAKREAERVRREQVKADLFALFGEQNPHRRGKALEGVLNRLFEVEQILIRDAFEIRDQDATGGTIEQIDGDAAALGSWLETDWSVRRLRGRAGRIGEVLRPDLLVETVGGWVGTSATKVFLSGLNATDSTALVAPTASGAGHRHAALRTASAGSDGIVLRADHALVGEIPALCNGTLARAARSLA